MKGSKFIGLTEKVITTSFTFASTTQVIVRNGLTPEFCDIDPLTFCIDVAKIEPLITENTTAILLVHMYGRWCDVEAINAIVKKNNLAVVYDAAHAFRMKYKDKEIADFGDISCFSFHATKAFHTVEGGCVCFQNGKLGERLARLKNFDLAGQEDVEEIGTNAKMDEFRAAMALCNLRHVEAEIDRQEETGCRAVPEVFERGVRFADKPCAEKCATDDVDRICDVILNCKE